MDKYYKISRYIFLFLVLLACADNSAIKESAFCRSLEKGEYILDAPDGWWHWGMAPIYDEDGKLHVFMSAIPMDGSWTKDSKIVHYIADKPSGPYRFADTSFSSNTATYTNPQISKVGNSYVMVYLWKKSSTPGINQSIGIATASSLNGKWTESPFNPVIQPSFIAGDPHSMHASNPTFLVDKNGKYRIYYKSISDKYSPKRFREISLAVSDEIMGPYTNYSENPIISYADMGLDIEDPYAFYYKGKYYMLLEDRMGVADALNGIILPEHEIKHGGSRPGLIYSSDDGIDWGIPEIGFYTNSYYFQDILARTERPHILWRNGKPEHLFLACRVMDTRGGFYLTINKWK